MHSTQQNESGLKTGTQLGSGTDTDTGIQTGIQTGYLSGSGDEPEGLFGFLKKSPTAYHAVDEIRKKLLDGGFTQLEESSEWKLEKGGAYFTIRGGSSVIAFRIGHELSDGGFMVTASHSDSPSFRIKEHALINVRDHYVQLNTEGYGGMICYSWLDRPLSIAGRALIRRTDKNDGYRYESVLVNFDRDTVVIPSVAIHMNREVNNGAALNKQVDMLPLFGGKVIKEEAFRGMIADEAGVSCDELYGSDLYLYNRVPPSIWGAEGEFISAGRLDDLECAYGTLKGFLEGANDECIQVYCCFDNEEVGSGTKQGAGSTFLKDVLLRITLALGMSEEQFRCMTARSFMLSSDNAHAVHPNHPEKTDTGNCAYMNEGIVVKMHAGQKYTSDGASIAVVRGLCEDAGIPHQVFMNRSDMAGGSTLGNIAMAQVSMNCVDIGLAQLAMHSAYETAGTKDIGYLIELSRTFFESRITCTGSSGIHVVRPQNRS